ncbi:hypothetical protein KUC3_33880 [Alteromonas sp. KC3]|uniref:glycosyltransferase family 2 protein n=1 Tax=unclassified Alteromonas TaxID=2614992 RepID=UPI0019208CB9|nr:MULTISPECIES: glycosyltransferase family 2 protein [unclassified Alteromonas]BCO20531.1 hypothetical protein KUC3_33880 [Alteromonas sp. KC3]BCO24500.1 hypothetical protein KUC14_33690 [Alteromonas sp. KC14]
MKKIIMRAVRAALQLVPKNLKEKLKQSERLTGLYIKSIRQAGLFYDAPTPKQTQALYSQWLSHHQNIFKDTCDAREPWQAVIFSNGISANDTIASVEAHGATCWLVFDKDNGSLTDTFKKLDPHVPTLMLNSGDTVVDNAVNYMLKRIHDSDIVYCDTDTINENGERAEPRFLPSWNPELLYSTAYIKTGVFINAALLKRLNNATVNSIPGVLASLALSKNAIKVAHVPFPFVHASALIDEIQQLEEVGQCINCKPNVRAETDRERKLNKVLWKSTNPLVSLIIPTKNGKALVKACIESILEKTTYPNYEILLIDNGSDEEESIEYFKYLDTLEKVTVLEYPAPFNYSAINNFGVKHANGSILGLINNDIEVISPDWLTYMVGQAERESIGCVGAKLLYSDTRIQHAGVVLGYGGGAGHAHKNFPRFHSGYLNRINATSNYSSVTAACLLVKKPLFDEVGGLNEQDLSVAFNDVDFCLKVKELGVQNVYCAEAELFHHESVSRGLDISPEKAARFNRELEYLRNTWANYIANDPAYSPNLTLKRENFSIKGTEELLAR